MDWRVPLLVSTGLFLVLLAWRVRPRMTGSGGRKATAIKEARARVSAAKSDAERAAALCDAGDAMAMGLGGGDSAIGYYLRAMRLAPQSAEMVRRASRGLAKKPRSLESLLWRRLGAEPWSGGGLEAARAALEELERLYEGPLRSLARARALGQARGLLGEAPPPPAP